MAISWKQKCILLDNEICSFHEVKEHLSYKTEKSALPKLGFVTLSTSD